MNPETPRANLAGFSDMTRVMAFLAKQPQNGGAFGFR